MPAHPPIMKPQRWLAHLPLAVLPFLAAAAIDAPRLQAGLAQRAEAALAAAGQDWARVTADGRDIEIRGEAPDAGALQRAQAAVTGIFGVRRAVFHVQVQAQGG